MSGIAFHDLPEDAFPFSIEFFRLDTEEVVHLINVEGPGAIAVPPLAKMHGVGMGVRLYGPDGKVREL